MDIIDQINGIQILIDELKNEAQILVDTYWALFLINNRQFFHAGEIWNVGKIAPRIREYKDPKRYRIVWSVFKKTKKNSPLKGCADKDISFPQRGLTRGSFTKAGAHSWEADLAYEYERKLKPIRAKMDKFYAAKKLLIEVRRMDQSSGF